MITKKILVVEDNESLVKLIRLKLKDRSYQVQLAANAEDALRLLKKELPDILWLDIYLPGMDGLKFLQKIRENPKMKNLAVVVVSVSGSAKKVEKANEFGVSDYLVKSNYKIGEIIDRIDIIIKNNRK